MQNKNLILILEDDKDTRDLYCEYLQLKLSNLDFLLTGDGNEAYELIKQNQANLSFIISDICHPGMNGIALLKKTVLNYPNIPFIIISLSLLEAEYSSCFKHTNYILRKPILLTDLEKIAKEILDR
jgi:DNA-binding NtrC family response regulator